MLDEAVALSSGWRRSTWSATRRRRRAAARAGTVFVGRYSAQAAGDYITGSNHVLPTSGAAAARGGLSAADFVRVSTVQTRHARPGCAASRRQAIALATAEGLHGTRRVDRIRTPEDIENAA